jgi:hypothetical protein
MKFTVYYGRDFYEKNKETGRQMVKRLLSKNPKNEYNKFIISVPDNKEGSHDRV